MYKQFQLQHNTFRLVCWLKDEPRLKVGTKLTLDKSKTEWEVIHKSLTTLEIPPETMWKVGGLI
jgi:hypothetical protein